MAAFAGGATARVPAPARRRGPSAAARQRTGRRGVFGGVVWIAGLAVLLAGVVALNVAVLRLNVELDELAHERATLRAANAALSAQLSSATATAQVQTLAGRRLGLVPVEPDLTTYVDLGARTTR